MKALLAASLLLLAGCPKNASDDAPPPPPTAEVPPPAPTATPPPTPEPTAEPTAPDEAAWLGTWISGSCGERKYPRSITLSEGGAISGQELISPCPPKVACVWSGIIPWKGSYEHKDGAVELSITQPEANPAMAPLPTELAWDGAPVEMVGDERCVYEKKQ